MICAYCGIEFEGRNSKYCSTECMKKFSYEKRKKKCPDCGAIINPLAEYCRDCAHKKERSYRWEGGKPNCVDCGKECDYCSIRCRDCYVKFNIGKNHPRYGKNFPNKLKGEESPFWKGDNAGYKTIHSHLRKNHKPPERCEDCGKKSNKLELANISGEYKRDISDYRWLCKKCHNKMDGVGFKKGNYYGK